ncbi:hypothetical protein RM543_18125 [Roseicyclus sp. F158]|uniref:Uncharacterized protein n=1 Tax=Tropicimonas omnivorans TaxID=3075590 RepID=A0ABU3DLW8_9RHOB|nr:hypothetical protein [Roseicyclus sp. F158]MDT0684583.1 hypothetical protein [Roseicyclus sp. F158]
MHLLDRALGHGLDRDPGELQLLDGLRGPISAALVLGPAVGSGGADRLEIAPVVPLAELELVEQLGHAGARGRLGRTDPLAILRDVEIEGVVGLRLPEAAHQEARKGRPVGAGCGLRHVATLHRSTKGPADAGLFSEKRGKGRDQSWAGSSRFRITGFRSAV